MRTNAVALLSSLLIVGLLTVGAEAKQETAFGSVQITGAPALVVSPPSLVGFMVLANPGHEKTISVPIPPYTFPVAVNTNTDDPGNDNNLDTLVVVTNVSGAAVVLTFTVRDANGMTLTTVTFPSLANNNTLAVSIASLLP